MKRTKVTIQVEVEEISHPDHLGRPTIHYSIAKRKGIKAGTIFSTPCGALKAVEYISWNPATNHCFCGFACQEVV